MQKLFALFLVVALCGLGCSSKIVISPEGVITADNYSIRETVKEGKCPDSGGGKTITSRTYTPNIPDRWYTSMFKQMADSLGPFMEFFTGYGRPSKGAGD